MAIKQEEREATAAPQEAVSMRRLPQSVVALLRRGPLPRVLIAIIAGSSVSLVGVLVYLYRPESDEEVLPRSVSFSVSDALAALDAGAPLMAQRMATQLEDLESLPPDEEGGPPFIFGVVTANDAERLWGDDQKRYFRLAARYLERSRDKGFPPGREAVGLLLLGKSLLMCGQVAESRSALEEALKVNPQAGPELARLLV